MTTATEALDRLRTTAASHHRVMVVELMGRQAGWITLNAGIASASDVILIPELEFDLDVVCAVCEKNASAPRGKRCTVIAVAEGARPIGGEQIVERVDKTSVRMTH